MKRVSSRLVVTHRGYEIARGYTEIDGMRFYDDQLVVGPHGEYVISEGRHTLAKDEERHA